MSSLTIELKGRVPSKKNSKRRIQRGHHVFMVPSLQHEEWHTEQMYALAQNHARGLMIEKTNLVEIEFTGADRRSADLSNKAESIMDLFVDAGILKDDNWFVVPKLLLSLVAIDKERPGALVKITF